MFEEEITRGVAVLDEYSTHKTGWVFHIDTDVLDMSCWLECVIGQLYGEFFAAIETFATRCTGDALMSLNTFSTTHGFNLDPDAYVTIPLSQFSTLTAEWRTRIAELRFERRALLDDATEVSEEEDTHEHR